MDKIIDGEFFRIRSIANGSDSSLELFANTPIYSVLKQRRIVARAIIESGHFREDTETFLNYLDSELIKFFGIKNS